MKCPFQKKITERYDYGYKFGDTELTTVKKTDEFEECCRSDCMAYNAVYGCMLIKGKE